MASLAHAAERTAFSVAIDGFLKHLDKQDDRTETYLKLVDLTKKFWGKEGTNEETLNKVKQNIKDNGRWIQFLNRVVDETDPHVAKTLLLNLGYEAFFRGTKMIRANRVKYDCNIPWLILF